MKYRVLAVAAALATAVTGVASVSAQPGHQRVVITHKRTIVRHTSWNNGQHRGWHKKVRVCSTNWRHHQRTRVCHWRYR